MAPRGVSRSTAAVADDKLNPTSHHFEFVGPYIGPIGIVIGLPILTWSYLYFCNASGWPAIPTTDIAKQQAWSSLTASDIIAAVQSTWSTEVFALYCVWWLALALMYFVVPARSGKGVKLRDGSQLEYHFNGLNSLLLVLASFGAWHMYKPYGISVSWLYDHYAQVITAALVFSTLMSVWLYWWSFQPAYGTKAQPKLLAMGGNSKIPVYDFFIGRELNPRVFFNQLDLKYFNELRPGLFLWFLFNLSAAVKQLETAGSISVSMWIVIIFEGYYVIDSVLNESALLTTMDIIMDGFGFMLCFGDLAWVPAVYTLQARYLAVHPGASTAINALAVFVGALGMYVFRSSNSQKDAWKRDPNAAEFKDIKYVLTPTGTKLLAEGSWWGVARHINYFADWLMAVAWCLPTGFNTPLTYFYPAYFAVLLIHRDMRDGEKCAAKYGKSWEEYCSRVPSRIVPGVY